MIGGRMGFAAWACLLAAGCGAPAGAPAYVGAVPGGDEVVGVVSDGSQATFYLCGGEATFATHTRWFTGSVDDRGEMSLSDRKGSWKVTGNLALGSGRITTDTHDQLLWSVRPAAGDAEGLYSATVAGSCRTGAVVGDFDGTGTVRMQGTWCDGQQYAQVIPIIPEAIEVTDQGIQVKVPALAKVLPFYVERVASAQ
jgi:hypothetical protein